jgi:hypothetical protein
MPGLPTTPDPGRRRSCLLTIAALVAFLIVGGILLLLPTGLIGGVAIIGGVFLFGLLAVHYFVWGRWLSRELQSSESAATDSNAVPPTSANENRNDPR